MSRRRRGLLLVAGIGIGAVVFGLVKANWTGAVGAVIVGGTMYARPDCLHASLPGTATRQREEDALP